MEKPIVLGGHFGNGIDVFPSGCHYTLQYGFVKRGTRMECGSIKKPDFQITEIGKEDMIKLATLLLVLADED